MEVLLRLEGGNDSRNFEGEVDIYSGPPTTPSLGRRLSIDNKEHSVFVGLFLAIEFSQFSF